MEEKWDHVIQNAEDILVKIGSKDYKAKILAVPLRLSSPQAFQLAAVIFLSVYPASQTYF